MTTTTTTAFDRILERLTDHGSHIKPTGTRKAVAQCPAHDDGNPLLSITGIDGQVLVYCHAHCDTEDVLAALGMGKADLFDEPRGAQYDYLDTTGVLLRSVIRTPEKKFRQTGNTKGESPLYRLPQVVEAVKAGRTIYLVEGEKDVHALESLGVTATTAPMGATNFRKADTTPLHGAIIVAVVDRDEAGQKWASHVATALQGKAASLTFTQAATGKDAADHIAAGRTLNELEPAPHPAGETTVDPLDGAFSADWLMDQTFPAVEYVVPGLIPEGLTLLVAPPKIGKSWMVLGLARAAAEGSRALGSITVTRRPVLYLALEDGPRRLQDRLQSIGMTAGTPDLMFKTEAKAGAVQIIRAFVARHADRKPLVILDTLGKVRDVYTGNDAYQKDYAQMSALKDVVDDHPGSSLIVVHHTNKGDRSDFVASVSGTQGLAGAADSILSIQRDRNSGDATLNVTSRDAAEGKYAVTLVDGSWTLDGDGLQQSSERASLRLITGGLGDDMAHLVETVGRFPEGITPKNLKVLLPNMDPSTVDVYLSRAYQENRVAKLGRGLYAPVGSVRSVSSLVGSSRGSNTSNTYNTLTDTVVPLHAEGTTDE